MTAADNIFYADLYQLEVVGRGTLPHIAKNYSNLGAKVDGTADDDPAAFGGCGPSAGNGLQGAYYRSWSGLRDTLSTALKDTADSVSSAGEGIMHVLNAYLAADSDAEQALKSRWEEDH